MLPYKMLYDEEVVVSHPVYRHFFCYPDVVDNRLNDLTKDGWSFISMVPLDDGRILLLVVKQS